MLVSSNPAPERILSMGLWGSGKTNSWVTIARWYRNTQTPGHFYVLDTDNTTLRTLSGDDGWEQNVTVVDVMEWENLVTDTEKFFEQATREDWLVVDSIDSAWQMVQDYFTEQVFGKDSAEFFMQARLAGQAGHPLASDYGSNWQVINKLYSKWIGKVIRFPGHVYACTPAQQVSQPNQSGKGGDSKEIRETFGRLGVRPAGQKALGFQMHSVLLMQSPSVGDYRLTTAKDRARDSIVNEPLTDFVLNYLIGVGGWQIEQ